MDRMLAWTQADPSICAGNGIYTTHDVPPTQLPTRTSRRIGPIQAD